MWYFLIINNEAGSFEMVPISMSSLVKRNASYIKVHCQNDVAKMLHRMLNGVGPYRKTTLHYHFDLEE